MATYITTEDADTYLGDTWADTGQKGRYVAMANAWLSAQRIDSTEPVPDEIKTAAAELAAAAEEGVLYEQHEQGQVTQDEVEADGVRSNRRYAASADSFGDNAALPQRVQFALALIEPYRKLPMGITVGYRNGCI